MLIKSNTENIFLLTENYKNYLKVSSIKTYS